MPHNLPGLLAPFEDGSELADTRTLRPRLCRIIAACMREFSGLAVRRSSAACLLGPRFATFVVVGLRWEALGTSRTPERLAGDRTANAIVDESVGYSDEGSLGASAFQPQL